MSKKFNRLYNFLFCFYIDLSILLIFTIIGFIIGVGISSNNSNMQLIFMIIGVLFIIELKNLGGDKK